MFKKRFLTLAIIGVAILFVSAGIYAKSAPDVIPLQDPAYKEHKKGVVQFHHKKHWNDYAKEFPDLYPNHCGECHGTPRGRHFICAGGARIHLAKRSQEHRHGCRQNVALLDRARHLSADAQCNGG